MKDRRTAALLAIFLGTLGIHKFYLGQNKYGILFLVLFIFLWPILAIISIIQGIIWLTQSDEQFYKNHPITKQNNTQNVVESSTTVVKSTLNKAKKFAQIKISKSYLTSCTWVLASESENIQYIFRENNELLVSKNGLVEKKNYELIVDNNSLLLSDNLKTELYNIVLIRNDFLFLNKVSEDRVLRFANQTKFKDFIKSELIILANNLEYEMN